MEIKLTNRLLITTFITIHVRKIIVFVTKTLNFINELYIKNIYINEN